MNLCALNPTEYKREICASIYLVFYSINFMFNRVTMPQVRLTDEEIVIV